MEYVKLFIRPCELSDANDYIRRLHRHHKEIQGHRWSLKAVDKKGDYRGVIVCGRPEARLTSQRLTLEVTRCCTDGTRNACSFLYGRATRIAKEMGFLKIQTFILADETGISLQACGWEFEDWSAGGEWSRDDRMRDDNPKTLSRKKRFAKVLV